MPTIAWRHLACAAVATAFVVPAVPASAATNLYHEAVSYRVCSISCSPTAEGVAPGDFDRDGDVDLAVADWSDGTVKVLPGNGDGTLGAPRAIATGFGANAVSAGDLDADGSLDLVVSNAGAGTASVLYGDGRGGFVKHADYPTSFGAGAVAIGDFDGNGAADFAVAAGPSVLFLGSGNREFTARGLGTGSSAVGLAADDIDGDSDLDIVVGDGWPAKLSVLRNRGDASFLPPVSYGLPDWIGPTTVQEAFRLADVTSDGRPDIVAVTAQGRGHVLRNKGDGSFGAPRTFDTGPGSDGLEIADLDADGHADLAVAVSGNSTVAIFRGDNAGGFTSVETHAVSNGVESTAVTDLNGDGRPDLGLSSISSPDLSVLIHV